MVIATVVYPLADVELELEGDKVQVVPAVAEHLPVSVLLVQSWGSCYTKILV